MRELNKVIFRMLNKPRYMYSHFDNISKTHEVYDRHNNEILTMVETSDIDDNGAILINGLVLKPNGRVD